MSIIRCPHCGTERNIPAAKLPTRSCNARCPACHRQFRFVPPHQSKEGHIPKPSVAVRCPHCGLQRNIAADRLTEQRLTISCRRCRHSFSATGAPNKQPAQKQLRSISTLLADSWELFCRRGWGLLAIYLLGSLLITVPLLFAVYFLAKQMPIALAQALPTLLLGAGYLLFCGAWISGAMLLYLCHSDLGCFAAIGGGLRKLWSFAVIIILSLLIIGGASLLLIVPGIIFCGWFFFAQLVLADENIGGLRALQKSRLLVRGKWWALSRRLLLLFLVVLAVSILSARIPLIGAPVHFIFSLLLTPFSLIYCYLIYLDLKQGDQKSATPKSAGQWMPLGIAALGWLLIPTLIFVSAPQSIFRDSEFHFVQSSKIGQPLAEEMPPVSLATPEPATPPQPQALSLADYDHLLSSGPTPLPHRGIKLGPLTLTKGQFWGDVDEPHLWLKLNLNGFPNLPISKHRAAKVIIDQVLDRSSHDHYNRDHSFEHPAFHWINFSSQNGEQTTGIRNVYLQQGTTPEQISSIQGRLEINLPLDIKQRQLSRNDIGKSIRIAGKQLILDQFSDNRISVSFHGKREELLSIRAVDQSSQQLASAGNTWQQQGEVIRVDQMFSGPIDQVTIVVASDSVTRRYPFEITQ